MYQSLPGRGKVLSPPCHISFFHKIKLDL